MSDGAREFKELIRCPAPSAIDFVWWASCSGTVTIRPSAGRSGPESSYLFGEPVTVGLSQAAPGSKAQLTHRRRPPLPGLSGFPMACADASAKGRWGG